MYTHTTVWHVFFPVVQSLSEAAVAQWETLVPALAARPTFQTFVHPCMWTCAMTCMVELLWQQLLLQQWLYCSLPLFVHGILPSLLLLPLSFFLFLLFFHLYPFVLFQCWSKPCHTCNLSWYVGILWWCLRNKQKTTNNSWAIVQAKAASTQLIHGQARHCIPNIVSQVIYILGLKQCKLLSH